DLNKQFVSNSRIGVMMPIMKVEADAYQGILATSKTDGQVTFTIVRVPKDASISTTLGISSQAIAIMANEFMGKPYGWGGIYANRDCSSTLRDIFQPFGLWLPRNSKQQSQIGRVYDISKLKPKQKEAAIIQNALPFQTLLYKPGHIMLYIGQKKGKAIVLHNIWGITTKSKSKEGRSIVGRTVITTLEPGMEISGYVKKKSLLNLIESMNIITMQPTIEPLTIEPKKEPKKKSRRQRKKEAEEKEKAEKEAKENAKKQPQPENDPKDRPKKDKK
ncbi:MAG: C40 family peptidase, partial [Thiovulaceae bacterium]|nr:C40 family peptidase [Sulfurimonadaceae bacterium]